MLRIEKDNREEIENEFMALLLNKNELFEITQIKPQYLSNKENRKIFEYCKECYEEHRVVNPLKIVEKHKDINFNKYCELLKNTFYYNNAWKEQLKLAEDSIIKFYKEDIINATNGKLAKKEIDYPKFMDMMKQLDSIVLTDRTEILTTKEIDENISTEKSLIEFKKYLKLNDMLQLVRGDFLVIGAPTGVGKSGFMLNLMDNLMEEYQCIYFNMEMSKSTIYKRLIAIRANIQINDIGNYRSNLEIELAEKAKAEIEKSRIIVEHTASDIKEIKSIVMKLKDKNRHTILFIDHLGLTRVDNKKNLYEQATEVAKQLRQMCLEYDCTIISASQLNRDSYKSESLSLSMLKDSGELENSASKVILLNRDKDTPAESPIVDMEIKIAKNRDGICGTIKMRYDKTKQIFREKSYYDN